MATRFPAPTHDEGAHPGVVAEWWFYTGHLRAQNGERYGFEVVFSKGRFPDRTKLGPIPLRWLVDLVYVASFTIADEVRHRFKYDTRVNIPLPWSAGADRPRFQLWNRGWRMEAKDGKHHLVVGVNDYAVDLELFPFPPFLQGHQGIIKLDKSRALSFYSYPRMCVGGILTALGALQRVEGCAWMIHQWGNATETSYPAWDWFDLKLDNGVALQIFYYREESNMLDTGSSGVLVYPDGRTEELKSSKFYVRPLSEWISPCRGISFPVSWQIVIPKQNLNLKLRPAGSDWESYTLQMFYWRGPVLVEGYSGGLPVIGGGEVEMTGHTRR